jgi:hypothetical protein
LGVRERGGKATGGAGEDVEQEEGWFLHKVTTA